MKTVNDLDKGLYSATEVAEYFVNLGLEQIGDDEGNPAPGITHLKLQKLLYFSQAYYLVRKRQALFQEEIEAWEYGPVVPSVWYEYKKFEGNPIGQNADKIAIKESDKKIIRLEVWAMFGRFSANELVSMIHQHTPWIEANSNGANGIIPKEVIADYYDPFLR